MITLKNMDWESENRKDIDNFFWMVCNADFNLPYGRDFDNSNYESYIKRPHLEMVKGDVFGIIKGEFMDTDKQVKICLWCYFEGDLYQLGFSSHGSFERNLTGYGGLLFTDVTKSYIRDSRIKNILNYAK